MAITITKKKPVEAVQSQVETETSSVADVTEYSNSDLADRYGELHDKIQALMANPLFNQMELVEAELKSRLEDEDPEEDVQYIGKHWRLDISPCRKNARKIKDITLAQGYLGVDTFMKIAKVGISDLEKYLTPDQCEKVIDSDTGYGTSRAITPKFMG